MNEPWWLGGIIGAVIGFLWGGMETLALGFFVGAAAHVFLEGRRR